MQRELCFPLNNEILINLSINLSLACSLLMFRFLSSNTCLRSPNRNLAGILSLASVGGAAALAASDEDDDCALRFHFPIPTISGFTPLRQFISQHCNPAAIRLSPLNFSIPSPISSDHLKKEASGEKGDNSECGRGCLARNAIAKAAATAGPAVVNISVTRGIEGLMLGKSMGSGTIIDPNGTILTCAHVVVDFEGARTVTKGKVDVTLQDGREYVGTVVNADLHSDIAIIKIKSKTPLPAVKLGSSSKLCPGDWVVAVGCPLSLQNTVTAGIVSCVDRKSSDLGLGGIRREYLQTDCAINEGNSGGPLVNLDGEVVGINMLKVVNADGLSFAVPIDSAVKIIEHFKKNGRVIRPWLGLKMLDLNDMIIVQLKEKDASFPDVSKGVLVLMVTPGSPADRAGFRPGDVVIEFDGKPVGGVKEIINIMGDKIGVPLKVLAKRTNNKMITLTVVPEEANPDR